MTIWMTKICYDFQIGDLYKNAGIGFSQNSFGMMCIQKCFIFFSKSFLLVYRMLCVFFG